ncbi:MAG: UDP-N-acetylmuramoyl-tripeptide--D-alanyl-D-alanine ligase [Deltaproteobacteria bacterium]|nr:UDP-N-acetylmuramoyl-tripeptide--D-alanyl-D-alanine ligase [Deltaproteobacteria bacterium]
MWTYTLNQIAKCCDGQVVGDGTLTVSGVFTDSRVDGAKRIFVALGGDNFDGHDFVNHAASNGAAAVLVSRPVPNVAIPQIVVADTLAGLTDFATFHRTTFKKQVAAVTGSAGKTTTRSLLATVLRTTGKVLEPEKNFNNHIGVPLTVLNLDNSYDAAVFELGCSGFNEIGPLTQIVAPHVALITNVGKAHLENLKNLEGVARAKGELFLAQRPDGCAILNADDPWIMKMPRCAERVITFSASGNDADVILLERTPSPSGQRLKIKIKDEILDVKFALPGIHNAVDATAAAAAALAMGTPVADIKRGLASAKAYPGRFNILDKQGICIIDDTYNANPSSMTASLNVLSEMVAASHRMAVLGDMLELGDDSVLAHREIGKVAAGLHLKQLFVTGNYAEEVKTGAVLNGMPAENIVCDDNVDKIVKKVLEISKSGDALLIKGSRGMKLERVVHAILEG